MSTTGRFVDDAVNEAERLQPDCRDAEGFGRIRRAFGTFPEDGCTSLRRNDRVGGILHHKDKITHRDGKRTTRAAFADNGRDHRNPNLGHHVQVAANGLRLAALLGANAGIGARRVDEGEKRQTELFRRFHQA